MVVLVGVEVVTVFGWLLVLVVGILADVPALPAPKGPVAWPSLWLSLIASGWLLGFVVCLLRYCTWYSPTVKHCTALLHAKPCVDMFPATESVYRVCIDRASFVNASPTQKWSRSVPPWIKV